MQQLNFSVNARSTLAQRSLNARSTLAIFCSLVVLFSNSGCKKKNNPIVATGLSIYQTKTATMVLNRTLQLTPTFTPENVFNKTLKYISSDSTIATVTDSGLITAIAVGSATITATTTDGSNKTDTVNITVVADADVSIKNFKLNDGTSDYILIPAGDNFTYPNAPRTFALPTTATLELGSTNATISPDPRTTPLSYANKTQFTVTSGDGTVTHTYYVNVGADAYDPTTNPYGIYTPAHLSDVRNALGASYKLMNDIALPNMTGYDNTADPAGMKIADYATNGWLPIGKDDINTTAPAFNGTFDGNGHVVSNLSIIMSGNVLLRGGPTGLVAYVSSTGVIKNLGVETSTVGVVNNGSGIQGDNNAGVIAGIFRGSIISCYAKGKVSGPTVGGLVGGLSNATDPSNSGNVTNCYSICTISSSGTNIIGSSGLVCFGGGTSNITNCYSASMVSSTTTNIAGIISFTSTNVTISNCYWDTTQYTGAGIGGGGLQTMVTGKTTADMKTQTTVDLLNGNPSSGAWKYISGSYPKLSWEQ